MHPVIFDNVHPVTLGLPLPSDILDIIEKLHFQVKYKALMSKYHGVKIFLPINSDDIESLYFDRKYKDFGAQILETLKRNKCLTSKYKITDFNDLFFNFHKAKFLPRRRMKVDVIKTTDLSRYQIVLENIILLVNTKSDEIKEVFDYLGARDNIVTMFVGDESTFQYIPESRLKYTWILELF